MQQLTEFDVDGFDVTSGVRHWRGGTGEWGVGFA